MAPPAKKACISRSTLSSFLRFCSPRVPATGNSESTAHSSDPRPGPSSSQENIDDPDVSETDSISGCSLRVPKSYHADISSNCSDSRDSTTFPDDNSNDSDIAPIRSSVQSVPCYSTPPQQHNNLALTTPSRRLVTPCSTPLADLRPRSGQSVEKTTPVSSQALTANQPDGSLIPKQHLSRKSLSFQTHWYKQYPWLHWVDNKILCFYCYTVQPQTIKHVTRCEMAFINEGYSNWKDALEHFAAHQKSGPHKTSFDIIIGKNQSNISGRLNRQHRANQIKARRCLGLVMASLKYLGRQGVAIRGAKHDDGNFIQQLRSRAGEVPEINIWLSRLDNDSKQRHFLSSDIQNEILIDYHHAILRKLQQEFQNSGIFALICDGTQDCSGKEQESICIRYVDGELFPQEIFVGLYEVDETTGSRIALTLQDVCTRLQLPLSKLRGQSYDGASNMSGAYSGAQAIIAELQPLAYYFHCGAHCVNLVLGEAMSCSDWKYNELTSDLEGPNKLRPLCPTRWSQKCQGVDTVLSRYSEILQSLREFLAGNITSEQKTKANGILSRLDQGATYLGLSCAAGVLQHLNEFSKVLQTGAITLEGTLAASEVCKKKLQALRDGFGALFIKTEAKITELDLDPLVLPRKRRPPARYTGPAEAHHSETVESHYRKKLFEVADTASTGLTNRFSKDNNGLTSYFKLCAAFTGTYNRDEIQKYPELDYESIVSQMTVFKGQFTTASSPLNAAECLRQCHPEVRKMFPAVEMLVRLLLVRPTTSCQAERSFSALRRLKTWLRSTMTAQRLNAVSMMHVHQKLLDTISDDDIIDQFVVRNNYRMVTFGD